MYYIGTDINLDMNIGVYIGININLEMDIGIILV